MKSLFWLWLAIIVLVLSVVVMPFFEIARAIYEEARYTWRIYTSK